MIGVDFAFLAGLYAAEAAGWAPPYPVPLLLALVGVVLSAIVLRNDLRRRRK